MTSKLGILRYPFPPNERDHNLMLAYIEMFAHLGEVLSKHVVSVQVQPPELARAGRLYIRVAAGGASEKLQLANRWWWNNYHFGNARGRLQETPNAWQPGSFGGEPEALLLKIGQHLYTGVRPWWGKHFDRNDEGTMFMFQFDQTYMLTQTVVEPYQHRDEPEHLTGA